MHYVLAIGVATLYIYFRFGKKALGAVLAIGALLAVARGLVVLAVPLLILAYLCVKGEGVYRRLKMPGNRSAKPRYVPGYPTIVSRFLVLYLNAVTGEISGTVWAGPLMVGRKLKSLSQADLKLLKEQYEKSDKESTALLYAYLDKAFPLWRGSEGSDVHERADSARSAKALSRQDARGVLGLESFDGKDRATNEDEIKKAHRLLMKKFHPDQGGAPIIAAKINMAKDKLL